MCQVISLAIWVLIHLQIPSLISEIHASSQLIGWFWAVNSDMSSHVIDWISAILVLIVLQTLTLIYDIWVKPPNWLTLSSQLKCGIGLSSQLFEYWSVCKILTLIGEICVKPADWLTMSNEFRCVKSFHWKCWLDCTLIGEIWVKPADWLRLSSLRCVKWFDWLSSQ